MAHTQKPKCKNFSKLCLYRKFAKSVTNTKRQTPNTSTSYVLPISIFFFQGTPIFSTRTGPQTGQGQTKQNSQKQGGEGVRLGTHLTAGKVTCGGAQAARF